MRSRSGWGGGDGRSEDRVRRRGLCDGIRWTGGVVGWDKSKGRVEARTGGEGGECVAV